jgi:hypothetical protein
MVRERASALPEERATARKGGFGRFDCPVKALSEGLSGCLLGVCLLKTVSLLRMSE